MVKDLNIRTKTIKLRIKHGRKSLTLDLLDMTPKAKATKVKKQINWTMKYFYATRDTISIVKRQSVEWEKYL